MPSSPLDRIEWSEPLEAPRVPPSPELVQRAKQVIGTWLPQHDVYLSCPWIIESHLDALAAQYPHLSPKLMSLTNFVVAQDNSCRFCYGYVRTLLQLNGFAEAEIRRLETDLHSAELTESERLALDFAQRLSRANPRPGAADVEALRSAGFDDATIAEIATCATLAVLQNRLATLASFRPAAIERTVNPRYGFLVKPFLLRSPKRRGPAQPDAKQNLPDDGPAAQVTEQLRALPCHPNVRRIVNRCWETHGLQQRTKGMMTAIVAQALSCSLAVSECREVVESEGLSTADFDQILSHLTSDKMSAAETRLVPVARETIRYQTRTIQTRIRELASQLQPEEVLEAIQVYAVANAMCRLSVLTEAGVCA